MFADAIAVRIVGVEGVGGVDEAGSLVRVAVGVAMAGSSAGVEDAGNVDKASVIVEIAVAVANISDSVACGVKGKHGCYVVGVSRCKDDEAISGAKMTR